MKLICNFSYPSGRPSKTRISQPCGRLSFILIALIKLEITSFELHLHLLPFLNYKYTYRAFFFKFSTLDKMINWLSLHLRLRFVSTTWKQTLLTLQQGWLDGTIQLWDMESMDYTGCTISIYKVLGLFKVIIRYFSLNQGTRVLFRKLCMTTSVWKGPQTLSKIDLLVSISIW